MGEFPGQNESAYCVICDKDETDYLFSSRVIFYKKNDSFDFVRCRKCGLIYINPRPSAEYLAELFTGEVYPLFTTDKEQSRKVQRRRTMLSKLDIMAKRRRVKAVGRHLQFEKDTRILDVGILTGSFLHTAAIEKGCRVTGVDSSEDACRHARETFGIEVEHAEFLESKQPEGAFDCVTMWHFLEHSPDPRAALEKASVLLKDDGLLVVEVPNLANWYWKSLGGEWLGHFTPSHLYGFTPATLSLLLERAGFEKVHTKTKPHIPLFFSSVLLKLGRGEDSSFFGRHILLTILALLADLPIPLISLVTGRGGAFVAFARKKRIPAQS